MLCSLHLRGRWPPGPTAHMWLQDPQGRKAETQLLVPWSPAPPHRPAPPNPYLHPGMQLLLHQDPRLFLCGLCPSRTSETCGCELGSSQRQGQPGLCTQPAGGDGWGVCPTAPQGPAAVDPTRARAWPLPGPPVAGSAGPTELPRGLGVVPVPCGFFPTQSLQDAPLFLKKLKVKYLFIIF